MEKSSEEIKDKVAERYSTIARQVLDSEPCGCGSSDVASSSCCGPDAVAHAARLYSAEELARLPEQAALASLGCGNPTAIAELTPGETVLDLGSGGGLDCFLAAQKVGDTGRVIGLDMSIEMIQLARRNAAQGGYKNVEFRLGEMEQMPLESASVDVVISNCVINLSPDKDAVLREAYRVLRPGGRLRVSDMVVVGRLPREVRDSLEEWAGCVAGALEEQEYIGKLQAAGFVDLSVEYNRALDADAADGQGGVRSALISATKPA